MTGITNYSCFSPRLTWLAWLARLTWGGWLAWPGEGGLNYPGTIRELSGNYPGTIQELSGVLPNGPTYLACPGLAWLAGLALLAGLAGLPGRLLMISCIDVKKMPT